MRIADLKIGTKLYGSFLTVVLIFILVATFQILRMGRLGELQDTGAGRARDAVRTSVIDMHLDEAYSVMADGMIKPGLRKRPAENHTKARAYTYRPGLLILLAASKPNIAAAELRVD
jgi:hypothetical protein